METNLPPKIVGMMQIDAYTDPECDFHEVRKAKKGTRHPMLLPLQLFETHVKTSQEKFQAIIGNINHVESKIQKELANVRPVDEHSLDNIDDQYRELSRILHSSSLDLAELERRRDFEIRLGNLLEKNLNPPAGSTEQESETRDLLEKNLNRESAKKDLIRRVSRTARMSSNRDLDIRSLPRRIESQKSVVSPPPNSGAFPPSSHRDIILMQNSSYSI